MARDAKWFENWCRRAKMKPVCRITDPDGDILVADSGVPIIEGEGTYYRTGYAIERGGVQLGAYEDYDPARFFHDGPRLGQQTRVNEAIAAARKLKADLSTADYWEWTRAQA